MTMRLCSVRSAVLRPSLRLSLATPQPMNSLRGLSFCAANEWIDGSTLFPSLHLPSFLPLLLPAQRCENQITPFWLLISFTREEAVHGKEGEKGKGIGEEQHVQHQQMAYCISINMLQLLQNKKKNVSQGIFLLFPHPASLSWWPKIESVICGSGSLSVRFSLSLARPDFVRLLPFHRGNHGARTE